LERLLFSAKESVYKAWFPLTRRWLDFTETEVTFDRIGRACTAKLLVPAPLSEMRGRWMSARGLLATAVVLG
jgi:4'-phosphopantetheinyl transferase EntD